MLILSAPLKNIDENFDTSGYFQSPDNDTLYSFKIETVDEPDGNGFLRLYDSIGRMVPVDYTDMEDLIETLCRVHRYNVTLQVNKEVAMQQLNELPSYFSDEMNDIRSVLEE